MTGSRSAERAKRATTPFTSSTCTATARPQWPPTCLGPRRRTSEDTLQETDDDLSYHATVLPEAYAAESTQLSVCGIYPQSTYSEQVPADQAE